MFLKVTGHLASDCVLAVPFQVSPATRIRQKKQIRERLAAFGCRKAFSLARRSAFVLPYLLELISWDHSEDA